MSFKSVLTVVTDPQQAHAQIAAAAQVTLLGDGHLDVLAVGIDRTQVGYADMGAGSMLTQMTMEQADGDAKQALDAANAALVEQPAGLHWSVETEVAQIGLLTSLVSTAARYADLVVQTLPYGKDRGFDSEAVVEAALFDGHAPVLIVPDNAGIFAPKRILLAWNDTPEALNAAKRALPLLKLAEKVDITVVDGPAKDDEGFGPGELLCQFLVRHGVKSEVVLLPRSMPSVWETLAQHALDSSADLLVMGAYGHSRLREALLGGTTRSMLEHSKVPVFMAR